MLGDGHMTTTKTIKGNPGYRSNHGWVQNDYNTAKYQVLQEFSNRPPVKVKNGGYGEWSSRWQTRNCPELHPIASLCLHQGQKHVTQTWLDQMTWEAVAWWYMDDGSRQGSAMAFNTQGFSQTEVELLASWLTQRGIEARSIPVQSRHKPEKQYHIIKTTVEATYPLIEHIRPWIVPAMQYKIALPERHTTLVCHYCEQEFSTPPGYGRYEIPTKPCCQGRDCLLARSHENTAKYRAKPGQREINNQRNRNRYAAGGVETREKCAAYASQYRQANPEKIKAIKQRSRDKQRANRPDPTCDRCNQQFVLTGPKTPKYCPDCRKAVRKEIAQRYQDSIKIGPPTKVCRECSQSFVVNNNSQVFCTSDCKSKWINRSRQAKYVPTERMPKPCDICQTLFTPTGGRQLTCGQDKCKKLRRKLVTQQRS